MNNQQELINKLNNLDIKEIKEFNFIGTETLAKVIRIHDPDTITIIFPFNNDFYKQNLRLKGIDAPELHSKIEEEALACRLGKKFLSDLILNKIITVKMNEFDKYGRILSSIYLLDPFENETDIIKILLDRKYVRPYGVGGNLHKEDWKLEELVTGIDPKLEQNPIKKAKRIYKKKE